MSFHPSTNAVVGTYEGLTALGDYVVLRLNPDGTGVYAIWSRPLELAVDRCGDEVSLRYVNWRMSGDRLRCNMTTSYIEGLCGIISDAESVHKCMMLWVEEQLHHGRARYVLFRDEDMKRTREAVKARVEAYRPTTKELQEMRDGEAFAEMVRSRVEEGEAESGGSSNAVVVTNHADTVDHSQTVTE